jgi:CBS domain-containing protein
MSRAVVTVTPGTGIKAAAELLVEHGIAALPVVERGQLVGIISEADLLPIELRPDPRSQATPLSATAGSAPRTVGEIMTREVIVVTPATEVSQAARIMIEGGIKRLPVMNGRRLVGIVSRRDLVRVIARRDEDIAAEIVRRLGELGTAAGAVRVSEGVVTIDDGPAGRRLAETVALTVAGVLEVRFTNGPASGDPKAWRPQGANELER